MFRLSLTSFQPVPETWCSSSEVPDLQLYGNKVSKNKSQTPLEPCTLQELILSACFELRTWRTILVSSTIPVAPRRHSVVWENRLSLHPHRRSTANILPSCQTCSKILRGVVGRWRHRLRYCRCSTHQFSDPLVRCVTEEFFYHSCGSSNEIPLKDALAASPRVFEPAVTFPDLLPFFQRVMLLTVVDFAWSILLTRLTWCLVMDSNRSP